jgi:hypothetical protein
MVGLVMNCVPVPIDVPRSESVESWLPRLSSDVQRLLEFEHVPFQQLHEVCAAHGVQAEMAFNFLNVNRRPRGVGFTVTGFRQVLSSSFPIGVDVTPGRETEIAISYRSAMFGGETIDRLLEEWRDLLESLPAGPRIPYAVAVEDRRRASLPAWLQ